MDARPSNIEMLPLPDELRYRYGHMEQAEHDVTVANYAHANVAHATAAKDAEIDAPSPQPQKELREIK